MTFHSRSVVGAHSVVGLGHLLSALTDRLTEGAPVGETLTLVREHFDALAVVLELEQRGRSPLVFVSPDCIEDIAALAESCHHLRAAGIAGIDKSYQLRIFRPLDAPAFDQDEQALAELLAAQIARVLELASRIDSSTMEKTLYSDALDKLNVGIVIVDATGRVCSASAVAERFLRARDGIHTQLGKLRAGGASEDRLLQAAIRGALQCGDKAGVSRGISLTRESGARTLGVMVRPMPNGPGGNSGSVAVYVRDCDVVPDVESEFVRQIFDLTPAEAAVTRRLTSGLSLEDAATSLDISRNTARAHLRSIFSKSGITRQTELVRLVLSSAALLGESTPHAA